MISRKAQIPLNTDEIRRYLNSVLTPLVRVHSSLQLYQEALEIPARFQMGFYDSLVLRAALDLLPIGQIPAGLAALVLKA